METEQDDRLQVRERASGNHSRQPLELALPTGETGRKQIPVV